MESLCTPILTIDKIMEEGNDSMMLVGNGCSLDIYRKAKNGLSFRRKIQVFDERAYNIYGLTYLKECDILFIYGERSIAVICCFSSSNPRKKIFTFKDWIQALHIFSTQDEMGYTLKLVTLSINNAVQLFQLDPLDGSLNMDIVEVTTVKSDYKAVIMHSILDGENWNTLRAVVGTVVGDIIIWFPSKSSAPAHLLRHHMGMIFGLIIKYDCLFSISDDRSLHMWSMDNVRCLDECYGHPTRPYSICDGPDHVIFTGGQDGSVCVWLFDDRSLSLLQLIHTGRGAIRSILFMPQELFFGTDCGFFGSITFPKDVKSMQTLDIIYPNLSVQAFVALPQHKYFILDFQGVLYGTNKVSVNEIIRCSSARSSSLKLSPCQKYIAFSGCKELHVVRVEDYKLVRFPAVAEILELFWVDNNLLLILVNFENILVSISEDMAKWESNVVQIDLQEIISCAIGHAGQIYLGTRKGSITVAQDLKIKQIVKRAHGKKSITDMKVHDTKLLSIGRDGKLCIWRRGNQLQLLSWFRPSNAVQMEWPSKFIESTDQLYIAGFHGSNFMVVNYDNGHCICDIKCGGGHRQWQLSIPDENTGIERSNSVCFEFVTKGRISRFAASVNDLHIVKPHLHLSNITSVATARNDNYELYITGGIDAMLVLFRFVNSGSVEVIQRLQAHSSSVYSICLMNSYLISVGGKSEIFIWHLEEESMQLLFSTRLKKDCRLLSVRFISVIPRIRFLVSGSDGRLLIYDISSDLKTVENSLVLFDSTDIFGIITKVSYASLDNNVLAYGAVSSTGTLHIWSFSELSKEKYQKMEVEKCGLSALDMYCENDVLYVGVGSESGAITIFQTEQSWKFTKCTSRWHSATCTDLCFHRTSRSFLLISIALDCRLAVFTYSSKQETLNFEQSILLNIADPSSLIVLAGDDSTIKCTVVGTSICLVYIGDSLRLCHSIAKN